MRAAWSELEALKVQFRHHLPHLPRQRADELAETAAKAVVVEAEDPSHAGPGLTGRVARAVEEDDLADTEPRPLVGPSYRPPDTRVEDAGDGYPARVGGKHTGWRDAAAVVRDVRTDIKQARRAGYLSDCLDYSVRSEKYAGGQSIRISVRGLSDRFSDPGPNDSRGVSAAARELESRVHRVAAAYNRDASDAMSDHFDMTYYACSSSRRTGRRCGRPGATRGCAGTGRTAVRAAAHRRSRG